MKYDLADVPIFLAYTGRYGSSRYVRVTGDSEEQGPLYSLVSRAATMEQAASLFVEGFRVDLACVLRGMEAG